jgi:dsRNA-specific ribonuclease
MFRLQQNIKNLKKSNNFISSQLLSRTVYSSFNLRFLPSASYSTKKIKLPEIKDEKLVTSIFTKYDRLDSFIGDKAYNYYAVRALKLKRPDAIRTDFICITSELISRKFLAEIAEVCELDKMMLLYTKNKHNLGEMMEAYYSVMSFKGMENEMKIFTSNIVDYYFEKKENKTDEKAKKVVKETNEEKQNEMKMNKNDNKNIKEKEVSSKNSKKKKKGTNNEKKKEILSIKGQ